jgi:sulfite exporter TauE/SafE
VGLIGEAVQLSSLSIAVLTLAVGAVMLLLGFQLTELFPRLKKLSISLPPAIGRFFGIKKEGKEYSHRGSFVAGALTFFLPCGFTQAMQLFALSTGSFTSGAMIMGAFALGTVPGLLSLGGVASAVQGSFARSFYKFTGVVVIVFAFITISNGLVLSGIKPYISSLFAGNTRTNEDYQRLFNSYAQGYDSPDRPDEAGSAPVQNEGNVQVIKTTFLSVAEDISPKIFTVERGKPVKFLVEVKENGRGCMSTIMVPGLYNRPIYLEQGKTLALEFTPERPGTYDIACAMGVTRGSIIVK